MTYRAIIAAGALSVGALLATASSGPARAEIEYPWCGYIRVFQGQHQSCTFSTLAQCQAYVTSMGYCDTNPRGSLARQPGYPAYPDPVRRR